MLYNNKNKKNRAIFLLSSLIIFFSNNKHASLKPDSIDRGLQINKYNEILIKINKDDNNKNIYLEKIERLNTDINKTLNLDLNLKFKQEINDDTLVFSIIPSKDEKINSIKTHDYNQFVKSKINLLKKNSIVQSYNIKHISPNTFFKLQMVPNDTRYNEQWNYFENSAGINLPSAWDLSTGNGKTIIAVLDTGITKHESLHGKVLPGKNFLEDQHEDDYLDYGNGTSYHGTHVAGIIAANGNKFNEISGIDWEAKILPIRVLGENGIGTLGAVASGIRYAAGLNQDNDNEAKIINLSLGAYEDECPDLLQDEINRAILEKNVTFIAAAGNSGIDAKNITPANCEGVLTVAAVNRNGSPTYYTNHGKNIDIAAPGGEQFNYYMQDGILSTTYPKNVEYMQGTSMAAPHVTGVVGLLKSINPELHPKKIKEIIQKTSKGYVMNVGIIDASFALEYSSMIN